jgi:hypothetical protein
MYRSAARCIGPNTLEGAAYNRGAGLKNSLSKRDAWLPACLIFTEISQL